MFMCHEKGMKVTHQKSLRDLKKIFKKYEANWDVWTNSPACFLNATEIFIIQSYLKTSTFQKSANVLGTSIIETANTALRSISKLNWYYHIYLEWEQYYLSKDYKHLSTSEQFLFTPIRALHLSASLKRKLLCSFEKNMKCILDKYTKSQLEKLFDLNQNELNELILELKKYGYEKNLKK